ncbi:hypothetical protein [Ornithinibacillus halophilus]|uniref:Uncharacterized protein n=1 Tax=Ornithinibacillus halophilus TaxID=930117 RepID=A0A1M5GJQ8_9BACI|nr:hypothetical protein [Ornithinibacillus halophilus]SHG03990.1 hypothetical protein SAMN05216225_101342 [Ornithinibacillus halophilus]
MARTKLYITYGVILVIFIISVYAAFTVNPFDTAKDRVDFIVTITSLIISLLAFIVAMNTYVSIDNVNRVTQLNGNILEDENYKTSLPAIFYDYGQGDSTKSKDEIFDKLELKFIKESKTAINFANNLQDFIEVLVIFPALFSNHESNETIRRMDRLITTIEEKRDNFLSIGTGNLRLIEETVKLIKGVTDYQKLISKQDFNVESDLIKVRGTMLKNSVSQTVYYNYLGLFYNKKAMYLIGQHIKLNSDNTDLFDIENHRQLIVHKHKIDSGVLDTISIYLQESKNAFEHAIKCSQNDTMWEGFIKYNNARTTYFLKLLSPDEKGEHGDWQELMDDAILARMKLNTLIEDVIKTSNNSYLKDYFIYQEYIARLVKINILIARKEDITDFRGNVLYKAPEYKKLLKDSIINFPYEGNFTRIVEYQDKIRKLLEV